MGRVAIVGGGITGLAAAYALEQLKAEGIELNIDLYEASTRLGGVIHTAWWNQHPVEMGPDSLVDRPRGAVELCRRLGLESRLVGIRPSAKPALLRTRHGWEPFAGLELRSYTLDGGLEELPLTIADSLQHTAIHRAQLVGKIAARDGRWFVNGTEGPYQAVVLTAPAFLLSRILSDTPIAVPWADRIEYQPRAVVAAAYPRDSFLDDELLQHTGFVAAPDAGLGLTALTWLSTKWDYSARDDVIVGRSFWGPPGSNPGPWPDDELLSRHEAALSQLLGRHKAPLWTRVARYDAALPRVPADLGWDYPIPAPSGEPYLGFLGPYRNGPGISDCVRAAWDEADRIADWMRTAKIKP